MATRGNFWVEMNNVRNFRTNSTCISQSPTLAEPELKLNESFSGTFSSFV